MAWKYISIAIRVIPHIGTGGHRSFVRARVQAIIAAQPDQEFGMEGLSSPDGVALLITANAARRQIWNKSIRISAEKLGEGSEQCVGLANYRVALSGEGHDTRTTAWLVIDQIDVGTCCQLGSSNLIIVVPGAMCLEDVSKIEYFSPTKLYTKLYKDFRPGVVRQKEWSMDCQCLLYYKSKSEQGEKRKTREFWALIGASDGIITDTSGHSSATAEDGAAAHGANLSALSYCFGFQMPPSKAQLNAAARAHAGRQRQRQITVLSSSKSETNLERSGLGEETDSGTDGIEELAGPELTQSLEREMEREADAVREMTLFDKITHSGDNWKRAESRI
ncbi:hypothetical protein EDB85DRAFT_1897164 [Lactarius pseudohatsudake]|nr:hypothetical protein EDB85DRAFT_1897164 [Lactarius pseudohatsudake]